MATQEPKVGLEDRTSCPLKSNVVMEISIYKVFKLTSYHGSDVSFIQLTFQRF